MCGRTQKKAVAYRSKILKKSLKNSGSGKSHKEEQSIDEDFKMVQPHKFKCRLLTPTEQGILEPVEPF